MTDRSLSHKSDGRHSSAHSIHSMHSVPSGRTSSLGLDTNFLVGGHTSDDSPVDIVLPPPGLFILGSVPSIIRCWLTTNFSHDALLYGVVCSGSQKSVLDGSLVNELGLSNQVLKNSTGRSFIKLPIYLPEAIITRPSSRPNSPAPQLPTLTTDFEIVSWSGCDSKHRQSSIRVFFGSDTLRAHNADILFSQNVMTLYSDDHNKISVPFVRPEDDTVFKNLCTTYVPTEEGGTRAASNSFTPNPESKIEAMPVTVSSALRGDAAQTNNSKSSESNTRDARSVGKATSSFMPTLSDAKKFDNNISDSRKDTRVDTSSREQDVSDTNPPETPSQETSGGIWGSWRSATGGSENGESTSGYQPPTRGAGGRNMKVLKPSKSNSSAAAASRSSSSARTGTSYEQPPSRTSGESRRKSQVSLSENLTMRWDSKRTSSEEHRAPKSAATLSKTSNPIGGASAFAWMNSGKPKTSTSTD